METEIEKEMENGKENKVETEIEKEMENEIENKVENQECSSDSYQIAINKAKFMQCVDNGIDELRPNTNKVKARKLRVGWLDQFSVEIQKHENHEFELTGNKNAERNVL